MTSKLLQPLFHLSITGLVALGLVSPTMVFGNTMNAKLPVKPTIVASSLRIDASILLKGEASPALKEQLEKIQLGTIMQPLGNLELARDELLSKLGTLADLFDLPKRIQILRKGEILSGSDIASRLTEICKTRVQNPDSIGIDLSRLPDHLVLPGPLVKWNLKPISTNPLGMALFSLEADCQGGKVRQIVQAEVWQVVKAAKINRLMSRGEIIGPEDVTIEEIKVKNFAQKSLVPFDQVIGQQLSGFKSAGSLVRSGDVSNGIDPTIKTSKTIHSKMQVAQAIPAKTQKCSKEDWIIKPGDSVDYTVKSGNLCLSVQAKAVNGGCVGDPIRLINLQNNRSIQGIIVGEGQVEHVQK